MLVNIRFKNFRSFYDEAELSMQASAIDEYKEINTFYTKEDIFKKGENELLKSAVIFGGNASGKSNVIHVLDYIKYLIKTSATKQEYKFNEHFQLLVDGEKNKSMIEIEFVEKDTFYCYGFVIQNRTIIEEWLDRREERLTSIFRRIGNNLKINSVSKKETRFINVENTTLFLSIANNYNLEVRHDIENTINWFGKLDIVEEYHVNSYLTYTSENGKYKEQALEILKRADIGIHDFQVVKGKSWDRHNINDYMDFKNQDPITLGEVRQEGDNVFNIDIETQFRAYDKNWEPTKMLPVRLNEHFHFNSTGTHRLLNYLGWILMALDKGCVIVIDELDSKLHFLVVDYILKMFNSIEKNPKNAQLIGTAHNTMLMDENLRRDQIYFTAKDQYGKSTLTSLVDYKGVRKDDLFSKKYLAGFYADLPSMKEK